MIPSRRRFLRSSLAMAGTVLLPPAMLGSCIFRDEGKATEIDYIGNQTGFEIYREYLESIKRTRIHLSTLEASLISESGMVVLDTVSSTKPAYIVMLLEQGKDILTGYPLGFTLGDYANISEFMERYGRVVGLMNPIAFYPSVQALKEIIARENISFSQVQVNTHPANLGNDFFVSGTAGTAQCLLRIVSQMCDSYPLSYKAEANSAGALRLIHVYYEDFMVTFRFDPEQIGWTMEFAGEEFRALADHTGMLAVNNEVEPRLAPDPAVFEKSVRANIQDFLKAIRERSEPMVNNLDGLSSIVLNNAVEESLKSGTTVSR